MQFMNFIPKSTSLFHFGQLSSLMRSRLISLFLVDQPLAFTSQMSTWVPSSIHTGCSWSLLTARIRIRYRPIHKLLANGRLDQIPTRRGGADLVFCCRHFWYRLDLFMGPFFRSVSESFIGPAGTIFWPFAVFMLCPDSSKRLIKQMY